jgi:hypothetical protein
MLNLLDLPGEIVSEIVDYYLLSKPCPSRKSTTSSTKWHVAQLAPQFYLAVQRILLREVTISVSTVTAKIDIILDVISSSTARA